MPIARPFLCVVDSRIRGNGGDSDACGPAIPTVMDSRIRGNDEVR